MLRVCAVAVFTMAGVAAADDLRKFDFPVPGAQNSLPPPTCAFTSLKLPADLRVYGTGAYNGRKLGYQIDQSGHEATQFDVAINSPDAPVAILLGAYEPSIWNIGWTRGTRIVAVVVSGYHRQAVAGLDSKIPVINSTYDNKGPCERFTGSDTEAMNLVSRKLFGKAVDRLVPGDRDGRVILGNPISAGTNLVTSSSTSPESFKDAQAPLAGEAGLDEAEEKGLLRPATGADLDAWVAAGPGLRRPSISYQRAYVVLGKFTFPSGLSGAHSAVFFVPRGVPLPKGHPGHCAIFDFNSLTCRGVCEIAGYTSADRFGPSAGAASVSPGAATRSVSAAPPAAAAAYGAGPPATNSDAANYGAPQSASHAPATNTTTTSTRAAIDAAVENGTLRLATRVDADAWEMAAANKGYRRPASMDAYVVLKRFAFPAGLHGENAVTFIVPVGMAMPGGDPGTATIFDYNTIECRGPKCR
jgi:hypothetical protein